jgi:hypothetical protein
MLISKLKYTNRKQPRRGEQRLMNWIPAAACVALLLTWSAARAFPRGLAAGESRVSSHERAVPFRVGETLKYRVQWAAFSSAASVELSVPERRDLYGWKTWHFRAAIHTLSPVRSLFQIDDQFDSYSDRSTFASHQFEEHLNELGRKKSVVMHLAESGKESKGPGPMVVVLPGTRDPLATLYELRTIDWQRTPEFRALVYDGKNLYEMHARRDEANEPVTIAAARFSTSRISIRLFRYQKQVAGLRFEVWLANDAARTPVLMRADLPFGNVRAELTSAVN